MRRRIVRLSLVALSAAVFYLAWHWWAYWPLLRLPVIHGGADG